MIIQIDNETLEKKSNKEISKVVLDILNGKYNYSGVIISGNDNYFKNKEMSEIKKCKKCGYVFAHYDDCFCSKCFSEVNVNV